MNNNNKPIRNGDIETTTLPDGHIVLVNTITNWAYTLTPLGSLVWEFCDGEHNAEQMKEQIQSVLELDRPSLEEEINVLLSTFEEEGFTSADSNENSSGS